jgi:hypothetical protein
MALAHAQFHCASARLIRLSSFFFGGGGSSSFLTAKCDQKESPQLRHPWHGPNQDAIKTLRQHPAGTRQSNADPLCAVSLKFCT